MQRKNHDVRVYVTKDEKVEIDAAARECGLPVASYIRFVLKEYKNFIYLIKEIKNDVNVIKAQTKGSANDE